MHRGKIIYASVGSISNLPVPPGRNYYVIPEEIPGYSTRMIPAGAFEIEPGGSATLELFYERDFGFVSLETFLPPDDHAVTVFLTPLGDPLRESFQIILNAPDGRVFWKSNALETGEYLVSYQLSPNVVPPQAHPILIQKGRTTRLVPKFIQKGSLQITTGLPQALFEIKDQSGQAIGQGSGAQYTVNGLDRGHYLIDFSSTDPMLYPPPESQHIFIAPNQIGKVSVEYLKRGKLTVKSDKNPFFVEIKPLQADMHTIEEGVGTPTHDFYLPEGSYQIKLLSTDPSSSKPLEVSIKATSPQIVYLSGTKTVRKEQARERVELKTFSESLEGQFIEVPGGPALIGEPVKEIDLPPFYIYHARIGL